MSSRWNHRRKGCKRKFDPIHFDNIQSMSGCFEPGSIDAERLFSYGQLTKNHLQCRMLPDTHARNVFLNKNKTLLEPSDDA